MKHFYYLILSAAGVAGSLIAKLLGGWDTALQTLLIFMAVDYLSGLALAGIFKKSNKSDTGALDSKAGWKGLTKKGMTLVIVLVAAQLDKMAGTDVVRNAAVIAYIGIEAVSIVENAGLMGIPVPKKIKDAISVLRSKGDEQE